MAEYEICVCGNEEVVHTSYYMNLTNVGPQLNTNTFFYNHRITSLDILDTAGEAGRSWNNSVISYADVGVREINHQNISAFLNISVNNANGTQVSCSYCALEPLRVCSDPNCTDIWISSEATNRSAPVIMNKVDNVMKIQFR